jgi:hypothetical protein
MLLRPSQAPKPDTARYRTNEPLTVAAVKWAGRTTAAIKCEVWGWIVRTEVRVTDNLTKVVD